MIKANELRIGNILNYNTSKEEVLPIVVDWEIIQSYSQNEIEFTSYFKPLELTPKWLKKFGFIQNNNAWSKNGLSLFDYNFSQGELNLILNASSCPAPDVKYVHQLQNLYFALTGKELEFN